MFQNNRELTEEERKWNLMWDLWVQGNAASPYAELMEYDSEVNNGGHFQYFLNGSLGSDLNTQVEIVLANLPEPLNENLKRAYDAFSALNLTNPYDAFSLLEDIENLEKFEQFVVYDKVLYENEDVLMDILKEYVNGLNV